MEKKDLELIEAHISTDEELKKHVLDHKKFEKILEGFKKRIYLTSEEESEQKKTKKLKLNGRDKIEQILAKYRGRDSAGT